CDAGHRRVAGIHRRPGDVGCGRAVRRTRRYRTGLRTAGRTADGLCATRRPDPDRRGRRVVPGATARTTRHCGRCLGGRGHRAAGILAGRTTGGGTTERAVRAPGADPQTRPGGAAAPPGRATAAGQVGRWADTAGSLPTTCRVADDGVRTAVSASAGRCDRQRLRPGVAATTPRGTGRAGSTTLAPAPADE